MSEPNNDDPTSGDGRQLWPRQRMVYLRCVAAMLECREAAHADPAADDSELSTVLGPPLGVLRRRLGLPDLGDYA